VTDRQGSPNPDRDRDPEQPPDAVHPSNAPGRTDPAAPDREATTAASTAGAATRPSEPAPSAALPENPRSERLVALCFLATAISGVALVWAFAASVSTQLQGLLLFVCLGGLGSGIIVWAHDLLPAQEYEEQRHPLVRNPQAPAQLADTLVAERGLTRRTLLVRSLLAALAGLGAALLVPIFSLGPDPGNSLATTPWKKGLRLVDVNNKPVNASSVPVDGVVTVFPEGFPGAADGQTLLIHVQDGLLRLPADRLALAPQGFVAYSKVCTHAGCPVGLYRASLHSLICPCHQSTFQVLDGATPVFGPAVRPLPQLPISLQADGTFIALGDFSGPVGPSYWDISEQ
jgi:ubiquinol-cytochrome c reductase iron-sulfur subunit